jgi:phage anti-repressor protein
VARHDDRIAVNARELWEKLEVKTKFADWIKRRIEMYTFAENTEWIALPISEKPENKGFQEKIDYFISLDMARELSMVENNAQVLISLNSCQA